MTKSGNPGSGPSDSSTFELPAMSSNEQLLKRFQGWIVASAFVIVLIAAAICLTMLAL